ncbi:MAG TPA: diversity-generating retroelement protein Avd [Anaerolineales bacterium]|nr:diversity-generating retroelement protein Avd [Anaerolineales bacterium]
MNESPIFTRTYDLVMWLIPQVQKFPRAHRFGLAERIQHLALDFQDSLVAAGKTKRDKRRAWLSRADIQLEQLRHWIRMARDLHLLNLGQYEHVSRMTTDVGNLLGSWILDS